MKFELHFSYRLKEPSEFTWLPKTLQILDIDQIAGVITAKSEHSVKMIDNTYQNLEHLSLGSDLYKYYVIDVEKTLRTLKQLAYVGE